jgi:hypothetical protein
MKLDDHTSSTTSRTIMLFAAESGIPLEMQAVDAATCRPVPRAEHDALMDPPRNGASDKLQRWTAAKAKAPA